MLKVIRNCRNVIMVSKVAEIGIMRKIATDLYGGNLCITHL